MSEQAERPYPSEHAATIREASQYDDFRRKNGEGGQGVDFVFGLKEGQDGAELQSIRFKLVDFSVAQARQWLEEKEYEPLKFEEATGGRAEDRAKPGDLKSGDFVKWNTPGGDAQGKITRIVRDGQIDVPASEFVINGTEEDPAALIAIYRKKSDGSWKETDIYAGHRFSALTKIAALRGARD